MLRSEVDSFIEDWSVGLCRIFKFKQEFMPDDYLLIKRDSLDMFTIDLTSTTIIPDMDREGLTKMMTQETLKFYSSPIWADLREIKTNGCTCGGWILRTPSHSDICKLYRKYT